jgi:hypothetical protein
MKTNKSLHKISHSIRKYDVEDVEEQNAVGAHFRRRKKHDRHTKVRWALLLFTALPACFRVVFACFPIFLWCGVLSQHFIPPQHFSFYLTPFEANEILAKTNGGSGPGSQGRSPVLIGPKPHLQTPKSAIGPRSIGKSSQTYLAFDLVL